MILTGKDIDAVTDADIIRSAEYFRTGLQQKANILTGFGTFRTCTLCKACHLSCRKCIHKNCMGCGDHPTYNKILIAKTTRQLVYAFRARGRYLQILLDKFMED